MTDKSAADNIFFRSIIDTYVVKNPRFIRRDWLAEEVSERLKDPDCRFVLLTAEPGAGKSAFIAQLAHDNCDWPRYFIRRDQKDIFMDLGVHSFLLRIGYQLAACFPELFTLEQLKIEIEQRIGTVEHHGQIIAAEVKKLYPSPFYSKVIKIKQHIEKNKGSAVGIRIDELMVNPRLIDPTDLQYMALIDPAAALLKLDPSQRIVILVDALDELRYHGTMEGSLLRWMTNCPEFPENIKFVISSRPPEGETITFCEKKRFCLRQLTISTRDIRIQQELKTYATRLISIPEVNTHLLTKTGRIEEFSGEIIRKADGNIGYIAALAKGIDQAISLKERNYEEGTSFLQGLLSLKELPERTQELYAFFLHQIKNSQWVRNRSIRVRDDQSGKDNFLPIWTEVFKPMLGILSIAFEPLKIDQIRALGGIIGSREDVIEAKEWLFQFLEEEEQCYRFYHASFSEFLINRATNENPETEDLYVEPELRHSGVVRSYLNTYEHNWSLSDTYGLRYIIDHVISARYDTIVRDGVLERILNDSFIKAIQERFGWLYSFIEDMEILAEVDPQRTVSICMRVLLKSWPNSLVFQRILRLLVRLKLAGGILPGRRSAVYRTVNKIVDALSGSHDAAVQEIEALLSTVRNPRLRGIVALALGETGSKTVYKELLGMLKTEKGTGGWMAADALIALNDTKIIPQLLQWYHETKGGADKERILYILGWMHAEEGRTILSDGLSSTRYQNVGRAIDLMWLLNPAEDDIPFLMDKLRSVLASLPDRTENFGPWKNEWVQKRLVRTLHKRGATESIEYLRRLQDHVVTKFKSRNMLSSNKLIDAIRIAIRELEDQNKNMINTK